MKCGNYDYRVMQGARFYNKIKSDCYNFNDYNIKMEIRENLNGKTILYLSEAQIYAEDEHTIIIDIGASITKEFPETNNAYYGIELIEKTNSENVISFLVGNFSITKEIPREE